MTAYDRPIPIYKHAPTPGNYQGIPINAHDPRYVEVLVDARSFGLAGENYYARSDGRNTPYDAVVTGAVRELWCRQSIVAMLLEVNERLAEYHAEVYLLDAYRPVACQQALWDFRWRRFRKDTARTDDAARSPSMFATTCPTHGLSIRKIRAHGLHTPQAQRLI
jgi:hypothetical protein